MSDQQIQTKLDAASDRWLALAVDDGTTEDTYNRFELQADGQFDWGSGSATPDTNLYRSAANTLKTDDSLDVGAHDGSAAGLKLGGTLVSATADEINRIADISGRIVTLSADTTLTAATHSDKVILLTGTGASKTMTLPAATGSGARFFFVVGAVNTSNHVITVGAGTLMYGNIITNSTGDTPDLAQPWPADQSDDRTITLNGTTTGGQAIGDFVEVIDIATNKYFVRGVTTTSGTEATPFS